MQIYEETIQVTEHDLDELDHVNNIRYIEWIQRISRAHWLKQTKDTLAGQMVWVVRRHDITYLKAATLGDSLSITTYIKTFKGAISTRIVEIKNNNTAVLLVKSITDWCLLDAVSMKPKRVSDDIVKMFQ